MKNRIHFFNLMWIYYFSCPSMFISQVWAICFFFQFHISSLFIICQSIFWTMFHSICTGIIVNIYINFKRKYWCLTIDIQLRWIKNWKKKPSLSIIYIYRQIKNKVIKGRKKLEAKTESKTKLSIKIVEINNNAMNKALQSLKI